MSLEKLHDELIATLEQGGFAEGIENFYAAEVVARENGNPARQGRDALAAAEREYLADVTAFHGIEVLHRSIQDDGNESGVVVYETEMRWTHANDGEVHVQQCVVERWKDGKVADIRFYGTFQP